MTSWSLRTMTAGLAVLLLVTLLVPPATAAAQSAVGIRGGVRWADVEASPSPDGMSDMVVGGYFGFGVSNRLAVQIEAVYGTRGASNLRVGSGELDADVDPAALEMTYIEIPLLLRAGFPGERLLPTVFFGPYVGFLLDCDLSAAGEAARACDDTASMQRFTPRTTDYGMVVGGGLDVAFGENTVFIDARYTLGLLSIQGGDDPFDARHTGTAISGGFAVPLGR